MKIQELQERRAWTLNQKIDHTAGTVEAFLNALNRKAFVSFSGGLDSTVLLDLCRRFVAPDIKGVFCNTGNEYPDIVYFVRSVPNVKTVRPNMTVRQVVAKHGFPLVSKEQSQYIMEARHTKSDALRHKRMHGKEGRTGRKIGKIYDRWQFLINAPFEVSNKCCDVLKKQPLERYRTLTGEAPIVGVMAEESLLRTYDFLRRDSCNLLTPGREKSAPILFWTAADIREYIRLFNVPHCPIYDDPDVAGTGCMVCGFGAHLNPARFWLPYEQCPKAYATAMRYTNKGVTLRDALHYVGVELPDDLL